MGNFTHIQRSRGGRSSRGISRLNGSEREFLENAEAVQALQNEQRQAALNTLLDNLEAQLGDNETLVLRNQIRRDGGTQSRAVINPAIVQEYADELASGAIFPPVTLFYDGKDYWLADGFHRESAFDVVGLPAINAVVHQGARRDAVLFSVGVNADHGLRRSNADKHRAVETLLRDEEWSQWSDREIARRCAVSNRFVTNLRQQISVNGSQIRLAQRSGTTYSIDTANIGAKLQDPVVKSAINQGVDKPEVLDALQTAHQQNPAFVEETLQRGHLTNLEGEDIPLAQADATLIEALTSEDHYERIRRQEAYVNGSREKKKQRAAQKAQERLEAAQIAESATEDSFRLYAGDFTDVAAQIAANSVDAIITDPPYGRDYLYLYEKLGKLAARVLKDGGSLIALSGQSYLPDVLHLLGGAPYLRYQWTLAYLTPGGQAAQLWQRKVNTFWKPALWYVKGDYTGDWIGDVTQSPTNGNDKRFHAWGQNEVAVAQLVERFSKGGDWILDPMCGASTTGVAALKCGRKFIGVDLDADCIVVSKERLLSCISPTA